MLQWCLSEALEGGFTEIGVVIREGDDLSQRYLQEGRWRDGLLEGLQPLAEAAEVAIFHQGPLTGVVGAIMAAEEWWQSEPVFGVLLPDNVRIAGPALLQSSHLAESGSSGQTILACHRVGLETRHYFANLGRVELDSIVPAGARSKIIHISGREQGAFPAAAEGAWRLVPRYTVTEEWLSLARDEAARASIAGAEADDLVVLQKLAESGSLVANLWEGTLVDAGNPAGLLYAQHLLHEALARGIESDESGSYEGDVPQVGL